MTSNIDGWPRKIIGHFFYDTSSLVHHFVAICEFKLEITVGKCSSQNDRFVGPCDLEISRMTSKHQRGTLQCHCKLCIWFCSHLRLQIGVTVRKRQVGAKFVLTSVTLTFDLCLWPLAWTSLISMAMIRYHRRTGYLLMLGKNRPPQTRLSGAKRTASTILICVEKC